MRHVAGILAGFLALAAGAAPAQPLDEVDAGALARRAASALRGERTYLEVRLRVVSRGRIVEQRDLRIWDDRAGDRSLVLSLSEEEEEGSGLLRLPPNVWAHEPAAQSTHRVPQASLFEAWPAGDFVYDDWLHQTNGPRDYVQRLLRTEDSLEGHPGRRVQVLEYLPRPGVELAWARIVAWIDVERGCPLRLDYFEAEGGHRRSLFYSDIRELAGRYVPHRWVMIAAGEKRRETRVELRRILFDPVFEDSLFTTRQLRHPEPPGAP